MKGLEYPREGSDGRDAIESVEDLRIVNQEVRDPKDRSVESFRWGVVPWSELENGSVSVSTYLRYSSVDHTSLEVVDVKPRAGRRPSKSKSPVFRAIGEVYVFRNNDFDPAKFRDYRDFVSQAGSGELVGRADLLLP
jgi:hypothetical protein